MVSFKINNNKYLPTFVGSIHLNERKRTHYKCQCYRYVYIFQNYVIYKFRRRYNSFVILQSIFYYSVRYSNDRVKYNIVEMLCTRTDTIAKTIEMEHFKVKTF